MPCGFSEECWQISWRRNVMCGEYLDWLVEIQADIYFFAVYECLIYQHEEGNSKSNDMLWFKYILCLRVRCYGGEGGEGGGECKNSNHYWRRKISIFEQNCQELSGIIHPVICWLLISWPGRESERCNWGGEGRGGEERYFVMMRFPACTSPGSSVVQERPGRDLDSISITQPLSALSYKHNGKT